MQTVPIDNQPITLGQLLKYINVASSGGEVKALLSLKAIEVNGERVQQRGRKLYAGDVISVPGVGVFKLHDET